MPIAKSQLLQYVLENSATCIQPGPSSMSYSVLLEVVSDFSYLFTFKCKSSFLDYAHPLALPQLKTFYDYAPDLPLHHSSAYVLDSPDCISRLSMFMLRPYLKIYLGIYNCQFSTFGIWFLAYRPGNVRVCHIFSYHAIVVERMVGIGVAWPKRIFESGQS